MLEAGRGADLGEEALGTDDGCELGSEHVERDLAPRAEVLGKTYRDHPALAELALDAVAALQRGVEACHGLSHPVPLP
jgi:hypothetical protein